MELTDFLSAFDALALERVEGHRFVAVAGTPGWCRELRPAERWDLPVILDEVFPFLGPFLDEADAAPTSVHERPLVSDFWSEYDRAGVEQHLFAATTNVGSTRAIAIIRSERLYAGSQRLLQRARELRLTHGALMREVEQKDILTHAIVHDLAAPLHSILGTFSLLDERSHPPEEARLIRLGIQAARRQREMISEILDIVAAESGALEPRIEPVDIARVLDQVEEEWAPVARSRDLTLLIGRPPPSENVHVLADEMRLLRVLANLLDNAVRASRSGGTTIRVTTGGDGEMFVIGVEDDGPGVPAELVPRLFEKFARARRGAPGGTGLGLFFSRISVENWGGGIGYERRETGGARFWVRLRRAAPPAPEGPRKDDG